MTKPAPKTLSMTQLKELAETDTTIDFNKLDNYALTLAKKTSKWNGYFMDEKVVFERCYMQYSIAKKVKHEYYTGDYHLIINKGKEAEMYLDADLDLLETKEKMIISKNKLDFIESTVKVLHGSGFNVKNVIEWQKFQGGAY